MTDLASLITRIEAATGPDRDLDLDILNILGSAPPWVWLDRATDTITARMA